MRVGRSAKVQLVRRDIVAAVIYYYITTEFHYSKRDSPLSEYGGVTLKSVIFTSKISKFRLKEGLKWAEMSINIFTHT